MGRAVAALVGALSLLVGGAAGSVPASGIPSGRVGAIYFDGWACPLSNFHFKGLVSGKFSGRRPLSGWRDATPEAMEAQLRWAHDDGIGFFLFDWYREDVDPCLNVAHDNYLKLADHAGVDFALLYVNHDPFGVSPAEWPAMAEHWITNNFLNPDYVRVGGKPLLVIFDTTLFRQQQGGTAGVNAALATLRDKAKAHGLPGVFVIGGRYTDYFNSSCFPTCQDTDGGPTGLSQEHYDALTEYAYTGVLPPVDGPRPYRDFVAAKELNWEQFAQRSPFPYVPSVMDGWDPRPWDERPYGHLFWLTRQPAQIGGFLHDAVGWVDSHPSMRIEPAPTRPVVLLEAWNELGEGGYVMPTDGDGWAYGKAVATGLGLTWEPPPRHEVTVGFSRRGVVTSTPSGLRCPPRCRTSFAEGRMIVLHALAKRGFTLRGWTGACKGFRHACSFNLLQDATARALFRR